MLAWCTCMGTRVKLAFVSKLINIYHILLLLEWCATLIFMLALPLDVWWQGEVTTDTFLYRVTLADQSVYEAQVVGFDQDKDVAVLLIKAPMDKLRPIPVGVSADLLVGQKVYAIGNPVSA